MEIIKDKVKLQTLVSTMNQIDYSLLTKMNVGSNVVVINQIGKNDYKQLCVDNKNVLWINSSSIGLSRSRNLAIQNANSDICVLSDDDLVYVEDYEDRIINEFKNNPDADIITFRVEGIEKKFKNYFCKRRRLNKITSMKVSSVEIAFRLSSIINNGIKFNEAFGAGSTYKMGEESIFLQDCINKGLKIYYVPIKIADLHIGESSWFEGFNEKFFSDLGAIYVEMNRKWSYFLILQYAFRKQKLYKSDISFGKALTAMLSGRKKYLNMKNKL